MTQTLRFCSTDIRRRAVTISHLPWGPLVREICLLDGSMQIIAEAKWAQFSSNQVELLVSNGIPRSLAQHYYALSKP